MPHNPLGPICTAATIHFSAAVPNFSCARDAGRRRRTTWAAGVSPTSSPCSRGSRAPPTRSAMPPGLGVEVNEDAVKAQSFKFWEAPHLEAPRRFGHQLVACMPPEFREETQCCPTITSSSAVQGPDRRAQGYRHRHGCRHARPHGLPQPAHGRARCRRTTANRSSGRR